MEVTPHLIRMAAQLGAAFLLSIFSTAWAQTPPTLAQQVIVKWRSLPAPPGQIGPVERAMSEMEARFGMKMIPMRMLATNGQVMRMERTMSASQFQNLIGTLAAHSAVQYAHEDVLLKTQQVITPNDPLYPQQLGRHVDLRVRDLNAGWGGRVAVVDTGVRYHPDLAPNLIGGYDFISDPFMSNDGDGRDATPLDPGDFTAAGDCGLGASASISSWHGTHVSGMIGAVSNNAFGVAGIGQDPQLIPIRALGRCGGRLSDIVDAVMWAAGIPIAGVPTNEYPARIINLSLGAVAPCLPTAQEAIYVVTGYPAATLVAAAGNDNIDAANFLPANCDNVIAVASVTRNDGKAPYSNFGSTVDVAAAGGDFSLGPTQGVISTSNAGTTAPGADAFGFKEGTSMATAHVTAIVALMSVWNFYTHDQIEKMLKFTTVAGTAPCAFPACIRTVNDLAAVYEAYSPIGLYN